ncbi:phage terminase large subunit family protein [Acinetobacter sp. HY1485]|uniref:phage terminase large subunit family protein n=1 Tax=Acinetobacter sp. HY1485 TaxID=2970918 RepID=UPI0022B971BD|nr:terminase family protein [Acinetobacter sp. HY1485]
MMDLEFTLTEPQDDFVFSDAQYPLFVGGFGAGKSESLFKRLLIQKLTYPKLNQGYFAPTYDLIGLIAFARISELLDECGLKFKLNKSEKVFTIRGYGQIICRTMENPDSIVGFEIADAVIDELDTLKTEHARNAWNKIIARCRQRKPNNGVNTCAVGTTPEGFRFCYERWEKKASAKYVLYRAPTMSNPYLPDSYIEGLRESYPPQLLDAYLDGKFVNLASGAVYPNFSRALNHTNAVIEKNEPLHVGMDFNVLKMAAVVSVIRNGVPYAVDELTGVRDTPTMAQLLKERFPDHKIKIYPDAAGQATSSKNSSESDHTILRQAGFELVVNGTNPAIKDRLNACNAMILNAQGERRIYINTDKCPNLTEALEQQAYDKHGMPDKEGGFDHVNDAFGYFIVKRFPIIKPLTSLKIGFAR